MMNSDQNIAVPRHDLLKLVSQLCQKEALNENMQNNMQRSNLS